MPPHTAKLPALIYGTAWKKERTRELVKQAILSGFRAIDTAAQPKHYQEHLVGQGIRDALQGGRINRRDLYIQTKFTPIHGQDPANIPYDAAKPIPEQVETSITSSLHNFRLSDKPPNPSSSPPYIDCLVLHSPYPSLPETLLAWRAMESHVPLPVHTLGVSNIYSPSLLRALWDSASVKPSVVQNRFYADTGYDAEIREFCKEKGVVYQSFWTLTANPRLLGSGVVGGLAEKMGFSRAAALYGLVVGLGNVSVLDGTTRVERMKEDLESVEKIRSWAEENGEEWRGLMEDFRGLLR